MPEDQELIKEILTGSQAAMEVLTRKYYKPLYAFVYRKIGNKETAYDLTQDIFIKMMQSIHSYSQKGAFKSWLFSIAVNHCRDYWKSAGYRQINKQSELTETLESKQKSVSYIFEQKETREQVKHAIHNLPEYQREAVILKYYHHLKIKEIATLTETSVSTVKSRLKQGLTKLSISLKRGEEDDQARRQK
ncbi:RNA polymerase sigma-70 factor (ECF subfamily) [Pullulanibacillus pueri]|uniref:RNA polymerase sigma factor n=1 Tax=Pullulanibacillus pueri TaxID=1437324 RepID=A0A8J2ZVH9_9BACL|nr:RNA polymerase sigma factor [Pullulanibacillus pueri]MBM7680959.1 RNA polymerase sigma-70 factor (ECF subfamily) [Pullulanibacillus pueri]GGH81494.1 RNA polymerase sigma factor [Pullulanibacillus pueri]